METKGYFLKLSDNQAKRENTLKTLNDLGAGEIRLISESKNIYCVEMDEGLAAFINSISK